MDLDKEIPSFERHPNQHSFILRCWSDSRGELRLRLIDVQTGQGYYIEEFDQLIKLVSNLTRSEQKEETTP
jgi:hypothetical protein